MTNILSPDDKFDFDKVHLGQPNAVHGGVFFSKILFGNTDDNLFIQSPKCRTKTGIITSGNKIYTDLLFTNNNIKFIEWLNSLEELIQKEIFNKRNDWFVSDTLSMDDIQSAFVSPIKVYKGSNFLLRSYLQNGRASINANNCQIFDTNEEPKLTDDITPDTDIISILEVRGVKFSQRSFQIDFNLKQIMLLNTQEQFNKCIIKPYDDDTLEDNESMTDNKKTEDIITKKVENKKEDLDDNINNVSNVIDGVKDNQVDNQVDNRVDNRADNDMNSDKNADDDEKTHDENAHDENAHDENNANELNIETNDLSELEIIDDNILNSLVESKEKNKNKDNDKTITLKKPNEVYLDLYKEARKEAKEAKKNAISAFLKAKKIKDTYSLEEIDDSDDDLEELLNN